MFVIQPFFTFRVILVSNWLSKKIHQFGNLHILNTNALALKKKTKYLDLSIDVQKTFNI
jgi:hypothetical protein